MKQRQKVYIAIIALEKAIDSIPQNKVWEKKGIKQSNKMIRVIQRLYKNNRNYIIRKNMESEKFTSTSGLR